MLLIHKVNEGQVAHLLKDTVLAALHNLLVLFVKETEVSNTQERLVKKLLDVILRVDILLCVAEEEGQQMVKLFVRPFHELLDHPEVHSQHVV